MSPMNLEKRITFSVDFRQGVNKRCARELIEDTLSLKITRDDYVDGAHPRRHFIVTAETPDNQDPFEFAQCIAGNLGAAPEVASAYSPHTGPICVRAPDSSYAVFMKVVYDHNTGE